jgi:hypothetical protein
MREFNRRRSAEAKSRRATPDELREATQRYKEIQDELRQLDLARETKQGEDRLDRYERELRLRAMREDFQANTDMPIPATRNPVMLALIMTVASFLLCAFCAGGTYYGLLLLNQTPTAQATADGFWADIIGGDYTAAHDDYLASTLAVAQSSDQFAKQAQAADQQYGKVTSAKLIQQNAPNKTQALLTYTVVRTDAKGKTRSYPVILTLVLRQKNWSISDYGVLFTPSGASRFTPPGLAAQPLAPPMADRARVHAA